MSSNWRPVLNNYLADFEARTTTALEDINRLLRQSGQNIDDRIKDYFMKSVKNRLEQTLDFFDIQSHVHDNVIENKNDVKVANNSVDSDSSDGIEIVEHKIKIETVELVSTSSSNSSESNQPIAYDRINYRPSLDSCVSDQRSTCSPSTSNQPMLSPVDTPDSTPHLSPEFLIEHIKKELDDVDCEPKMFDDGECVVKMEDVPTDQLDFCKSNEPPSPPSPPSPPPTPGFSRTVSQMPELQTLKRQQPMDMQHETSKRPKTFAETQLNEPSLVFHEKSIAFACFHCHSQPSFFVDTFNEVYEHWKQSHSRVPFRYFVVGMAACFYCETVDVFPNLQGHHKHRHHSEIFVVVDRQNRSKCGLCQQQFSASEMVVHFKSNHDPCLLVGINSPVCFNQNDIENLLIQNSCHELPSQVAFMCGHCNVTKKMNDISFFQHIERDVFQYKCSMCPVMFKSIKETADHEQNVHNLTNTAAKHANNLLVRLDRYYLRTRIIFNNGLVLFKHNLLNTKFDDRKDFGPLKERIVQQKYKEYSDKRDDIASTRFAYSYRNELLRQRTYRNNLCITGITTVADDEILRRIFVGICTAMETSTTHDVETIFQRAGKDIIVKFKNTDLKKTILKQWQQMSIVDRLEKLKPLKLIEPKIDLMKINVLNDLTDFFRLLWQDAQEAKDKQQIHSFWISENGLSVKVSMKSPIDIIWSKADLIKCIRRLSSR